MEIFFDTKNKINDFLDGLVKEGSLDLGAQVAMRGILRRIEPFRKTLSEIHRSLWRSLPARLGLKRGGAGAGQEVAAKLDNLLVALHGFAIIFTAAAVIPAGIIYRRYSWIVPFLLICPLWHLYASRVLNRRLGDGNRADRSHVAAGMFAIVPLALSYAYFRATLGIAFTPFAIPAAWMLYTLVLALRLRTREAVDLAIWMGGIFMNALLLQAAPSPVSRVLSAGNALVALAMLCPPYPFRRETPDDDLAERRVRAGSFAVLSVIFAAVAWFDRDTAAVTGGALSGSTIACLLALPFFPFVLRRDAVRVADDFRRRHYLLNLAATGAFFLFVQLSLDYAGIKRTGRFLSAGRIDYLFLGWTYLLALSWSLWLFLGQARDIRSHHETILELGAIGLTLCFISLIITLFALGWWPASLAAGLGVFFLARRELVSVKGIAADDFADAYGEER